MADHSNPKEPEVVLDRLHIEDLHVRCIVGINPEEREKDEACRDGEGPRSERFTH